MDNFSKPHIDPFVPHQGPEQSQPYAGAALFSKDEIEQSISDCFERQAHKHPNRLAVQTEKHRLSYRDLNQTANRIARAVLAQNTEQEAPIALLLEHDAPLIATILGVLKTGRIYVPLDPSFPHARNAYILEDSQAGVIITGNKHLALAGSLAANRQQVINIDEIDGLLPGEDLGLSIPPDRLAYILYTSGSTGQPKGVVQNHRNILYVVVRYGSGLRIIADDRLSLLPSCSVTASVSNIFGALLNGAALFPFDVKERGVADLADWLIENEISVYRSVPTVFRHFANTLNGEQTFPKLRLIRLGGEQLYKQDMELYQRHFSPGCILINGCGTSEMSNVWQYTIGKNTRITEDRVPVGYPLEGVEFSLLDDLGNEVACGEAGEIVIKSRYLSPGYWRKPEITQTTFKPDPDDPSQRLYHTGDLGYRLADGCLVHIGRKDFQVKVRGYRIEAGEVERALLDLPAIKEAVVVARDDCHGDKRLIAYFVSNEEQPPPAHELRSLLAAKLPEYMMPSAFVLLEALPLTPNGKINRLALPAPEEMIAETEKASMPPRTRLEETLSAIWAGVLKREQIGIHDNFFELGGHSLLATQLLSRVRDVLELELPLHELFKAPTVAGLAEGIERAHRQERDLSSSLMPDASRDKGIPLSFAQQRLWFLDQLEPTGSAYNIHKTLRLKGALDVAALTQSFSEIVRRHEALRTTFTTVEGQPAQLIHPAGELSLPTTDLRDWPVEEREAEAKRLHIEQAHRPFDLSRGPLIRIALVRLGEEEHLLLLTLHHIISDGWSTGVLFRELAALYEAHTGGQSSQLAPLPLQYADFAVWQRQGLQGEALDKQLAYWKQQLGGSLPMLELPTDRPRPPVQDSRGAQQSMTLPKNLSEALKALSQREGVTLFMTLLAAFQLLLHRYSGQDDILVGTPMAGRNRLETESLIGFFISTLVMRTDLSGNPSFRELLSRVRKMTIEAYAHQELPFEKLVEELQPERNLSRNPIFDVLINFNNAPQRGPLQLTDLKVEPLEATEPESRFSMTLYIRNEGPQINLKLVYQTALFSAGRIVHILDQLRYLLEQISATPERPIQAYSLVTPTSQHVLPDLSAALPEPHCNPITETFLAWAAQAPARPAVAQGGQIWSYRDLQVSAQALAHALVAGGLERGEVVAVTGPRSFGLIAGLLGVLLSGGVLLTIDRSLPAERQQLLLRETGAKRILYLGDWRSEDDWMNDAAACLVTQMGADGEYPVDLSAPSTPADTPLPLLSPDDPAYVFFTSGTSGVPKAVLGCHKGLSHFLKWQRETFAIGPQDRCAQLTGLAFDVVLRDIFLPLTRGASLYLPEASEDVRVADILPWLEREQITLVHTVPALAQAWLSNAPTGISLRALRWVFFAGEPLSDALVSRWREAFPEAGSVVNLYGPTETTLAKCFYIVPADLQAGIQPIGHPLPDTQALVLGPSGRLCGLGETGEIALRTPFRTLGYLNAPEENRKRFIKNPLRSDERDLIYRTGDGGRYRLDGSLEILGRLDDQVKIRGVRVEPGEVTAVLSRHTALDACAVVACKDEQGQSYLAAYVVASGQPTATVSDLRSYLAKQLPAAMVPSAFVWLETLPLTANGKLDRRALPDPDGSRPTLDKAWVAPRTPVEERLAAIWAEVLKLDRVGIEDNFFDLGGHSLLATQVISRVCHAFKVTLPLRALFEAPTVASLAMAITQSQGKRVDADEMARLLDELER